MVLIVKLIGIAILVLGVVYLLSPNVMKQCIGFWAKGKRVQMGGGLSLLFGVILLVAASRCAVTWVVATFGVLGLIKGVALFVLGSEKVIAWINWWRERPDPILRLIGVIALTVGALLIYSA